MSTLTENLLRRIVRESIQKIWESDDQVYGGMVKSYGTAKDVLRSDNDKIYFKTLDDGSIQVVITCARFEKEPNFGQEEDLCRWAYEGFLQQMGPYMKIADKNGYTITFTNPTITCKKRSDGTLRQSTLTASFKIVDQNGNVSNTIAKQGWEYCATVVPVQVHRGNDGDIGVSALVTMAPKFENSSWANILKTTVAHEKCDGCGRTVGRGTYIIYYNEETNKIVKLGLNCARNKYGYNLKDGFITRLGQMLRSCSYDDLVAHDPDGFAIPPHLNYSSFTTGLLLYDMLRVVQFLINTYPGRRMKDMVDIMWQILNRKYYSNDTEKLGTEYYEWIKREPIPQDIVDQYKEYWENTTPQSDWSTLCKDVALVITNNVITLSKNKERFTKVMPYTVFDFLIKKDKEKVSITLKPGDAVSDVKCKLIGTQYFSQYDAYLVKLADNKGIVYCYWSRRDTTGMAQQELIIKHAIVKKIYDDEVQLQSGAEIITMDKQDAINQRNAIAAALNYPEEGTRLKNVQMTVEDIQTINNDIPARAIIKDKEGRSYFLFLYSDYMGRITQKPFPYKIGDTITVTGTVQKKDGRNGVYYYLSRANIS